jgi:hypothetical protein
MNYPVGSSSVSIEVGVYDDSGLPVTALVASGFPTMTWALPATADTTITLSDLAALTSAYASGGVKERGNGRYRLDVPNAMFSSAGVPHLRGEATGKHVLQLEPIEVYVNYDLLCANAAPSLTQVRLPSQDAFGATVPDANEWGAGLLLQAVGGAGQGQVVWLGPKLATGGAGTDRIFVVLAGATANMDNTTQFAIISRYLPGGTFLVVGSAPSTIQFVDNLYLSSTLANHYKNRVLTVMSGAGKGQQTVVTGSTASTGSPTNQLTFVALPVAPAAGDVVLMT